MPPPPSLIPHPRDAALDRWSLRIGIVGTLLMAAYMAALPMLAS